MFITFVQNIKISGRLFSINEQHEYSSIIDKLFPCNCKVSRIEKRKFYVFSINGKQYEVDQRYVTESNIAIPIEDQNFQKKYNTKLYHDQTKDYKKDCKSC